MLNHDFLDDAGLLVGIDWAYEKHDACIYDIESGETDYQVFKHSAKDIRNWLVDLRKRCRNKDIVIAIELKSGPIIQALLEYDYVTIIPIAPHSLARYREAFASSGAKDDPTDAFLLVDFVYHHFEKCSTLQPDDVETRKLTRLVEQRRVLVQEKVRITNRLQEALRQYYPQALEWFDDIDTPLFCSFIERWPTFEKVKKARKTTLENFFHENNCRYSATIGKRIESIKSSEPFTRDNAIIDTQSIYALVQINLLKTILSAIKNYDKAISEQFKDHDDYTIFNSLPGAGPVFGPRLLAAFGSKRDRYESSENISKLAGVSPVMERSGKTTWIHWRYSCPTFTRQTFVEWSYHSTKYSYWASKFYDMQKAKGKSHQTILRSLAFKWIRIIFRCWKDRVPYDESAYLMTLKEKGSPLAT